MELLFRLIEALGGLLLALAKLLAGISAINHKRVQRRQVRTSTPSGVWRDGRILIYGGGLVGILVVILTVRAGGGEVEPKNAALVTAAWNAFNAKDYTRAISKAQECLDEFRGSANREQKELEEQKLPVPLKGRATDVEKQTILGRGLLNDVATSYYIIGRSAEYLGRKDLAVEAYGHAARYTYARAWDPGGWFWSPSEVAGDRLNGLKK